jgi:3-dehydroquinate dehydratase-2
MLGHRPRNIYGDLTLEDINKIITAEAIKLNIEVDFYQSNHEGDIIDKIHTSINVYDGYIMNLGAYSHYSIAIRDAVEILSVPIIEVHLSNIYARENFRVQSLISSLATGVICGLGYNGYVLALKALKDIINGDAYVRKT